MSYKSLLLSKTYDYCGDGLDLFLGLKDQPYLFFLDSNETASPRSRYSFLGFDPFEIFTSTSPSCLDDLKNKYNLYAESGYENTFPFNSGIVGYLSYEYGLMQEKIPSKAADDLNMPASMFGFYDCIITIDHMQRKVHITSTGLPEQDVNGRKKRAQYRLDHCDCFVNRILSQKKTSEMRRVASQQQDLKFKSNFKKEEYLIAVEKLLNFIKAGDIYQANLSQRFELDLKHFEYDVTEMYSHLRRISPTSFMAFLKTDSHTILSSSPERFLNKRGRIVQTRPMKGTRPRGNQPDVNQRWLKELQESDKDRAELLMITDLERNDLGKVCEFGTIKVNSLREIESYPTVFQATSEIEGVLKTQADGFDVLKACFPSGSITGCPKIRAMQIINDMEPSRRGIYTGTLGYMSFRGDMDFNILIRTILINNQRLYFQVGGGVVSDSTAEGEYHETLAKAHAIKMSLKETLREKV